MLVLVGGMLNQSEIRLDSVLIKVKTLVEAEVGNRIQLFLKRPNEHHVISALTNSVSVK